jgi:peptide deformylase
MALLNIIKYGHPTLRKVAEAYGPGEITQQFVNDMIETMKVKDGVGLAAPQVNVSKRFIVATDFEKTFALVNPVIIGYSETTEDEVEGCLSIPGLQGQVRRPVKIVVRAAEISGKQIEIKTSGLLARVLQHEIDHLNGIVYLDRADKSSLEWIEGGDKNAKPITLDQVQQNYSQLYHQTTENLVYERQAELRTI